ncbi:MAG TPA: zinc-finger domain-containing protein [Stellaceae bacterium]|nr:zinc-finger domain-containing protein [Stellaceae bacterium]
MGTLNLDRIGDLAVSSAPGPAGFAPGLGEAYAKFRNDDGVAEIRIGVREFNCIGVTPPHDHPHVYLNMGETDTILCPYCVTRFRFDPSLTPSQSDPPECVFFIPERLGA